MSNVRILGITNNIPLFIIFRALGIESDKEILSYILYDIEAISPKNKNTPKYNSIKKFLDVLRYSIVESNDIYNQHQALQYLSQ